MPVCPAGFLDTVLAAHDRSYPINCITSAPDTSPTGAEAIQQEVLYYTYIIVPLLGIDTSGYYRSALGYFILYLRYQVASLPSPTPVSSLLLQRWSLMQNVPANDFHEFLCTGGPRPCRDISGCVLETVPMQQEIPTTASLV